MCRVQSPRLATVEALSQVRRVPEVEVADLRALDAHYTEEMSRPHLECLGVPRRHHELGNFGQLSARPVVESGVQRRQLLDRTGGALRGAAASGGGVVCADFVMLIVPPKVGSDPLTTRMPHRWSDRISCLDAEGRRVCPIRRRLWAVSLKCIASLLPRGKRSWHRPAVLLDQKH